MSWSVPFTVVPRPTLSLCSLAWNSLGFVLCSKCPALFQNSIAVKNSLTGGFVFLINVLGYFLSNSFFAFFPPVTIFNIAQCIGNYICLVARKLESHCTSQILNEYQDWRHFDSLANARSSSGLIINRNSLTWVYSKTNKFKVIET